MEREKCLNCMFLQMVPKAGASVSVRPLGMRPPSSASRFLPVLSASPTPPRSLPVFAFSCLRLSVLHSSVVLFWSVYLAPCPSLCLPDSLSFPLSSFFHLPILLFSLFLCPAPCPSLYPSVLVPVALFVSPPLCPSPCPYFSFPAPHPLFLSLSVLFCAPVLPPSAPILCRSPCLSAAAISPLPVLLTVPLFFSVFHFWLPVLQLFLYLSCPLFLLFLCSFACPSLSLNIIPSCLLSVFLFSLSLSCSVCLFFCPSVLVPVPLFLSVLLVLSLHPPFLFLFSPSLGTASSPIVSCCIPLLCSVSLFFSYSVLLHIAGF